jgi:hypothetical protein
MSSGDQLQIPWLLISRLGQLKTIDNFLGASHQLVNMKCARIMKNGVDWHQLLIAKNSLKESETI